VYSYDRNLGLEMFTALLQSGRHRSGGHQIHHAIDKYTFRSPGPTPTRVDRGKYEQASIVNIIIPSEEVTTNGNTYSWPISGHRSFCFI